MLDLDGTLYDKNEPIPGAREALQELKASGVVLRYVTNTTRKPRRAVYEQLQETGFEVGEGESLTPTAVPFVAALEYASGKGATVVGEPEEAFFRAALGDMGLDASEVVVVGDGPESDVTGGEAGRARGRAGQDRQVEAWRQLGGGGLILDSIANLPGVIGV